MKIQYFPDTDTLYIELSPVEVHETRDLDEDTLLDLDAAGRLCAITIEHASDRVAIPAFSYEEITAAAANPLQSRAYDKGGKPMKLTRNPGDEETEAKIALMLEFKELAAQMRREVPSLKKRYPDQWVALVPGGELFAAESMDDLLAILDEKGLRDANLVVEFLDTNPRSVIV